MAALAQRIRAILRRKGKSPQSLDVSGLNRAQRADLGLPVPDEAPEPAEDPFIAALRAAARERSERLR